MIDIRFFQASAAIIPTLLIAFAVTGRGFAKTPEDETRLAAWVLAGQAFVIASFIVAGEAFCLDSLLRGGDQRPHAEANPVLLAIFMLLSLIIIAQLRPLYAKLGSRSENICINGTFLIFAVVPLLLFLYRG